jgi:hypothetical protein
LWEGVSLEKKFAKNLQDSLGNTLNDDKNRPMWVDTIVVKSNTNGYAEFIQFRHAGGESAFTSNRVNEADPDTGNLIPGSIPNMPISAGQWAVIKTINPSGEIDDITSVNLFNPIDRHSNFSSMIWTIKSVNTNELIIEYTFGPQLYDTLFVKTFRKL